MMGWLLGTDGTALDWSAVQWLAPDWAIALIAVALVVALALSFRRAGRHHAAEMVCWALALLGLGVALAEPALITEGVRREPGRMLVLIDGSASMSVREAGQPRSDAVTGILQTITDAAPDVVAADLADAQAEAG